jgi:hypothetical protein
MELFASDRDILVFETAVFGDIYLPGQVLCSGTGAVVAGTSFLAAGEDFIAAKVQSGGVIYLKSLDETIDACFEIVSIDSETQLSISVLRQDGDTDPIGAGTAVDVYYRICTYRPQIAETSLQLAEFLGLSPMNPAGEYDVSQISNADVLRRACVFSVLSCVYAMQSNGGEQDHWAKSLYYKNKFERARERLIVGFDTSGDGVADAVKIPSSVKLRRD